MAFDADLADRIRAALGGRWTWDERRMFGGLAFLIGGNMAVAATSGGLMVRVPPGDAEDLIANDGVERMVMQGRPLRGWLLVDPAVVGTTRALTRWVGIGAAFATTLAPKASHAGRRSATDAGILSARRR